MKGQKKEFFWIGFTGIILGIELGLFVKNTFGIALIYVVVITFWMVLITVVGIIFGMVFIIVVWIIKQFLLSMSIKVSLGHDS